MSSSLTLDAVVVIDPDGTGRTWAVMSDDPDSDEEEWMPFAS